MPMCRPCCQVTFNAQTSVLFELFFCFWNYQQLSSAWKHKHCSWHRNNPSTLLNIRGRDAARDLVISMVHYIKLTVPFITVCYGTDHNMCKYIHYREKYRSMLGPWATTALYKQINDRRIHTAYTGDKTQERKKQTNRQKNSAQLKVQWIWRRDEETRKQNTHNACWGLHPVAVFRLSPSFL